MIRLYLLALILSVSCKSTHDSVFVEKIPDDLVEDEFRYDRDNKVFTVGREFLYKFSLSKGDSILRSDIDYIELKVLGTTKPFSRISEDYSQTVIEFNYLDSNNKLLFKEKTGVIENSRNIWVHPPRSGEAGILQLSAFPYIKFGKVTNWNWKLGASYNEYQNVHLIHSYKKGSIVNFNYHSIGDIPCLEINGITTSEIGSTTSYFLYNDNYGFVYMEFRNIDETIIKLTLTE